ncbi:MAG: sulfatase [Verrucomicrobiota bacterium]
MKRILIVLVALVTASFPLSSKADQPPNVILFLADDLGWTGLSCFGSDFYETPNLDRLADEGMKFTDAYAACTVCSPTRASIMTGRYPGRLHLTSFIPGQDRPFAKTMIPDWTKGLDSEYTTLAEAFKDHGYRTIHVGKWHLNFPDERPDPTQHGFDFSEDSPPGTRGFFLSDKTAQELGRKTNHLTDHFAELAVEQIEKAGDDPFFLYFAFRVPHTPIQGRQDLVEYFENKVDPDAIHRNPTYAAMVKSMDLAVGSVLDALDEQGIADNTLVVFTSDNGGLTQRYGVHDEFTENLPLRRGKGSAYEGGVRVPWIVKWPGVTNAGSACSEPVMTIDLYPTLLDAAGKSVDPADVDGANLIPLLNNPSSTLDRDLFWHFPHYHAGGDSPYTAIRSDNWRLIEFHEDHSLELYDLENDIGESTNVAADNPETAAALHKKIKQWRRDVAAQMPTNNPAYDPDRATELAKRKRN